MNLWTEKYRPETIDGYVFTDNQQRAVVEAWISSGSIPNLLFSGAAGVGKTTLARILIKTLDIDPFDVLEINASRENSVDTIRDKISGFVETMPFGKFKVVLLDESDFLSPNAQASLRNLMESYHQTARFILTCVTGDTKIYTPFGFKRIDQVGVGDEILSNQKTPLTNRSLVKSLSHDVYRIETRHGFSIDATGNHKFWTVVGEKTVSELVVNDKIPVNVERMYGNNFEYADSTDFFNQDDFKQFLKSKNVFSESDLIFLRDNSHLWFYRNHQVIYDYLKDNKVTTTSVTELTTSLNLTAPCVRGFIGNIKSYVIKERRYSHSFTVDLDRLIADVTAFNELITSNNIQFAHTHKNQFIGDQLSQEQICDILPEIFTDDHVLSIGRLIGYFEGDGHISTIIHCAANNAKTLDLVEADIRKFVDLTAETKLNGKNTQGLCKVYQSKILRLLLEYFGATFGNKSSTVRHLPKWAGNKLFFKGFIQGFYDADGKKFVIGKDDLTVSPIHLRQSIYEGSQIVFFEEIQRYLKRHFDIDVDVRYHQEVTYQSSFGGSDQAMSLISCKQSQVLKYLECIGHYYDKTPRPEILGYLYYKNKIDSYNFLRFSEWLVKYYGFGFINDDITSITKLDGQHSVYDCSFDDYHWYITNGFVSHNCNYPHKVIPALHSRCQGFHVDRVDLTEFTARAATVLVSEAVEFDLDTLDVYVRATYPDLRKCLNTLQMNSTTGTLLAAAAGTEGGSEWKIRAVELFKSGKPTEARKLMCSSVRADEMDEVFTWLYQNLELWSSDPDVQDEAIKIIRDGAARIPLIADAELNLSGTLVELAQLSRGS